MRYTLTDLRLFVAIADAGNISRGAAACFLSPSSASLRIKGLEETLRVQLLERLPRGVVLTQPGRILLEHGRRCLAELEQLHANLAPYAEGVKGHVTLFATSTALASFLPADLTEFLKERPSVRVSLEGRFGHEIIAAVADGRADIGALTWEGDHPDLSFAPYREDTLALIAPEREKIARLKSVAFTDCLAYPFVSLTNGSPIHTFLQNKAALLGQHLDVRIQVGSFTEVIAMVRQGIGVAILPQSVVKRARAKGLRLVALTDDWAHRDIRLCWRSRPNTLSEHALALIDLLRQPGR